MDTTTIKVLEERIKNEMDEEAVRLLQDYYSKRKDYEALKNLYLTVLSHEPNHVLAMRQLARLYANRYNDYIIIMARCWSINARNMKKQKNNMNCP